MQNEEQARQESPSSVAHCQATETDRLEALRPCRIRNGQEALSGNEKLRYQRFLGPPGLKLAVSSRSFVYSDWVAPVLPQTRKPFAGFVGTLK